MKPGWKTSEFWLTLAGIVLVIVLSELRFHWLAALMPALATTGYALSRGLAKWGLAKWCGSRPFPFWSVDWLTSHCFEKHEATPSRAKSTDGARDTAKRSAGR